MSDIIHIFNIHYITEEDKDNPLITINDKKYTPKSVSLFFAYFLFLFFLFIIIIIIFLKQKYKSLQK